MFYFYSIIFKSYINGFIKHGREILINVYTLAYYIVWSLTIFPFKWVYNYMYNQNCLLKVEPNIDFVITLNIYVIMHAHLCMTLCNPMDCSLLDFSVHRFSRQEYMSGFPFPTWGDLPAWMMRAMSPVPSVLQVDSLPLSHGGDMW